MHSFSFSAGGLRLRLLPGLLSLAGLLLQVHGVDGVRRGGDGQLPGQEGVPGIGPSDTSTIWPFFPWPFTSCCKITFMITSPFSRSVSEFVPPAAGSVFQRLQPVILMNQNAHQHRQNQGDGRACQIPAPAEIKELVSSEKDECLHQRQADAKCGKKPLHGRAPPHFSKYASMASSRRLFTVSTSVFSTRPPAVVSCRRRPGPPGSPGRSPLPENGRTSARSPHWGIPQRTPSRP